MKREEFLKKLPGLVKGYKPSPDVLKHIKKIRVLIVVGPSGVGKTTLVNRLKLKYVLSDNTRPPRPGELEGQDFFFRSDYQTVVEDIQKGRFVQVAVDSGGDLKATKVSSYPKSGEVVMAIVADVVPLFRSLGFQRTLTAFITPPTYEEWMRRMKSHQLGSEQYSKRISEAKRSFRFALNDKDTHFILNDSVEASINQIEDLIEGRANKIREDKARSAAKRIIQKLDEINLV